MDGPQLEQYPHDLNCELAFLGCLMLCDEDEARNLIRRTVTRDAFYLAEHGTLYALLNDLAARGRAIDAHLVLGEMRQRGFEKEFGGIEQLAKVLHSVVTWRHGEEYG